MAEDTVRYFKLGPTSNIDNRMTEYYIRQFIASGAVKDVTDEWKQRQQLLEATR